MIGAFLIIIIGLTQVIKDGTKISDIILDCIGGKRHKCRRDEVDAHGIVGIAKGSHPGQFGENELQHEWRDKTNHHDGRIYIIVKEREIVLIYIIVGKK